jgi:hypothetical protein
MFFGTDYVAIAWFPFSEPFRLPEDLFLHNEVYAKCTLRDTFHYPPSIFAQLKMWDGR